MADRRVHGETGQEFWKRESEQKYKARIKTSLQGREARIFSVGTEELAALVFDLIGHVLEKEPCGGCRGQGITATEWLEAEGFEKGGEHGEKRTVQHGRKYLQMKKGGGVTTQKHMSPAEQEIL